MGFAILVSLLIVIRRFFYMQLSECISFEGLQSDSLMNLLLMSYTMIAMWSHGEASREYSEAMIQAAVGQN